MEYQEILKRLKRSIAVRYPESRRLAGELSQLLGVAKRTIHHKLSGRTQFSVEELFVILDYFKIPAGEVLDKIPSSDIHSLELVVHDLTASKEFRRMIDWYNDKLSLAAASNASKLSISSNSIPEIVHIDRDWMSGFAFLKWLFYNKGLSGVIPLTKIVENRSEVDKSIECRKEMLKIKQSVHILSINMVSNYAAELMMFYSYKIITKDEIIKIIEEVEQSLDDLEKVCYSGHLTVSDQKVEILYSDVPLYNTMYIIESSLLNAAVVYAQYLNPIYTLHSNTYELFCSWFDSWRRLSNQMSEGGIKNAVDFLSRQRASLKLFRTKLEI